MKGFRIINNILLGMFLAFGIMFIVGKTRTVPTHTLKCDHEHYEMYKAVYDSIANTPVDSEICPL